MTSSSETCGAAPLPDSAGSSPAEAALIHATVAGDARAFDSLVQLYGARIFSYLHRMTRQPQDAEDLAQQTFVKAYHGLHRFDTNRPLIGWLLTIARRTALNHFRSARRWEPMPEEVPATEASPAQQAEGQDQVDDLWARARRSLSPREYEVLWLRFAEELSVAETARVVGLTQTHVKILVFRSRKKLLQLVATP
jgi:RNA polymerase sigma-70 factor (ECF subfamily)